MKRKFLATLLTLVVALCSLGLFACGGGNPPDNSDNNDIKLSQYFVFDNVTVTRTMVQTTTVAGSDSPLNVIDNEANIKLKDGKWNYVGKNAGQGGDIYYDLIVNYDGENTYVTFGLLALDNVKDESYNNYGKNFLLYANYLVEYENKFVKSSETQYKADEINYLSTFKFKEVIINITNEKISSITFDVISTNNDVIITQEYEFIFADWGQTILN